MKTQRLNWELIVSKFRPAPEEAQPQAPFGFATRVVAQWQAARRDESLRRWASWSFRTALASMVACAVLAFVQTLRDSSILMPLPEVPAPANLPTPP
jgi:hypothetical protein